MLQAHRQVNAARAYIMHALESRVFLSAFAFGDEFNGTAGSGPSSAWGRANPTDPNNSNVIYTNTTPAQATSSNPTTLAVVNDALANDGKALALSLKPSPTGNGKYDSAEISTQFDPSGMGNSLAYGHIEARIRLPGGSNSGAIWPAFWLLGDNISTVGWPASGEIDVMENRGSEPGVNHSTLHGPTSGGGDYNGGAGVGASYTLPGSVSFNWTYHIFAADWGPSSVTFSVDGTPFYTLTPANLPSGATWVFNGHPFYLILDVCEGGSFAPGTITTTQTMYVDYIHVTSYTTAPSPPLVDQDIGSPAAAGSAYFDGLTHTLNGSGSDIYNKSDQFNFASQPISGNATLVTTVDWVSGTAQYAKGGLMIRDGTAANSTYAFIQLNPAGGGVSGAGGASLEFRNGTGTSAYTIGTDPSANLANGPVWLKLVRSGNIFSGYDSFDGTTWVQLGSSQSVLMSQTVQAGLADDSYANGTISTDTFSNLNILPGAFSDTNVGSPLRVGTSGFTNPVSSWVISGGGTGISGTSDQLNDVSQTVTGDTAIIADLTSQSSTNYAAMAGLMFRDTVAANAAYAAVVATPSNGAEFLWRSASGGITASAIVTGKAAPLWLELLRSGNTFSAFFGTNGITWTQLGVRQTLSMGTNFQAGLAVTSSDAISTNIAQFINVGIFSLGTSALANPATVTTTSTALTVGTTIDVVNGSAVTYTWSASAVPVGGIVSFSINGTAGAQSTTATFNKAGSYTLLVTVRSAIGIVVATSSVASSVNQTLTGLSLGPSSVTLDNTGTQSFAASANDQFGDVFSFSSGPVWSIDSGGAGSVTQTGVYSAPVAGPGTATVRATYNGVSGTASVITNLSVINGTSGADIIRLVASGSSINVFVNSSTVTYSAALASLGALSVYGLAGNDTITLDWSGGSSPIPSAGITVDGGTGTNTLSVIGTSDSDTFTVKDASHLTVNGSSITLLNDQAITITGGGGADTLTQSAQLGNAATLAFDGGPATTLNVNAGTYTIPAATSGGFSIYSLGALSIGANASVVMASASTTSNRTVLVLGSLSLNGTPGAWTAKLDVGSDDLIVHNGNPAQIENQVAQGLGDGTWSGAGISSSAAATSTSHLTAIGVELNNNGSGQTIFGTGATLGSFDGQSPVLTDVLVKYTYWGDANLDGQVDGSDYTKIDNGFTNHLTGWSNGNFDYKTTIDGSDYTLIDNSFNTQGASLANSIATPLVSSTLRSSAPGHQQMPTAVGAPMVDRRKLPRVTGSGSVASIVNQIDDTAQKRRRRPPECPVWEGR